MPGLAVSCQCMGLPGTMWCLCLGAPAPMSFSILRCVSVAHSSRATAPAPALVVSCVLIVTNVYDVWQPQTRTGFDKCLCDFQTDPAMAAAVC